MSGAARLPPPLPIRVRPLAGETAHSYIRRLARANHLRPSLLHAYVREPLQPNGAVQPDRLAAVSGRTAAALTHALTDLVKAPTPSRARPAPTAVGDTTHKAELFAAIRADAAEGMSIRQLAARHRTHRRTVRRALTSPTPPPRKKPDGPRPAPRTDPIRDTIDALRQDGNLTIWQIWSRLVDDHDADIKYSAVAHYIRRTGQATDPAT